MGLASARRKRRMKNPGKSLQLPGALVVPPDDSLERPNFMPADCAVAAGPLQVCEDNAGAGQYRSDRPGLAGLESGETYVLRF